jgi:hypothetical protein
MSIESTKAYDNIELAPGFVKHAKRDSIHIIPCYELGHT